MYKIMLADDEGIVIDSVKFIIEKEFGDQCMVEFAKTGRSVIELAESFRPDIAIMDIQMPGINGIEAMKEIRSFSKNTIFIVMSAYDKFDYAKEAIKLGVMEYITKPMERTKIVDALSRAMKQIDIDREKRSNELLIKEKLETIEPIIESGLVYNILLKEHFKEDIESYMSILELDAQYGYMMAIVCGDEQRGNHMTNAIGSSIRISGNYSEIRNSLKEYFKCVVGSIMSNKIAVFVPCDEHFEDYNERIELINRARELVRELRKGTEISFRIGIGAIKPIKDLSESYQEALKALVATTGSVAHVDDLPIGCEYEDNYPIDLEKSMFDRIERGDTDKALEASDSYFEWMRETQSSSVMAVKLKILEFVLRAETLAYQSGGQTYRFNARDEYLPQIIEMSDFDQMKSWFLSKISEACKNILSKKEERSNSIIEQAKSHIRENFAKDISLDDVSRTVNISPYYFSKIFKEETGVNFIEYLTNIRIDKAKELLSRTDYSMKEICSMCGYSDPNYFSRSFKKNVGVTPTEYKEGKTIEN
jgi:two-component system response regulator YesN